MGNHYRGAVPAHVVAEVFARRGRRDQRESVSIKDGKLYLIRGTRPPTELLTESGDLFFRKGIEGRILFHRTNHQVDILIDRRNNEDILWKKLN